MYGRQCRPFLYVLVPVAGLVCLALGFLAQLIRRFFLQREFQFFLTLAVVGIRVCAFFFGLFLFLLLDEEVEPAASGQTDHSYNAQEFAGKAGEVKVLVLFFGLGCFFSSLFGFFLGLLLFQLSLERRLLFGFGRIAPSFSGTRRTGNGPSNGYNLRESFSLSRLDNDERRKRSIFQV